MPFDYSSYLASLTPWFYAGMALLFLSLIAFEFQKRKIIALFLLVSANLLMSGTYSLMQPFLHMWDEQFHALVAKNLMHHPLKPTLIDHPNIGYSYKQWVGNHVWLHKQPWFLWQIALAFKVFGVSEFTLRIPSMLMFSGLLLLVYRMGIILKDKRTGFYAAFLMAGSRFLFRLVTGAQATDHNDVAFVFYVTASLWAWMEFQNSRKNHWIYLIGLFSGIAILNKWLPGLLVYSGWFFTIVFSKEQRFNLKYYLEMLKSFAVTVLTALPWQLYILWRFPRESRYEYSFNSTHFFDIVEKHKGDYLFYYDHFSTLYGINFKYFFLGGLILFLLSKIKKQYKTAFLSCFVVVYGFYTAASTKMIAFPLIVSSIVYLVVGFEINTIVAWIRKKWHLPGIVFPVISVFLVSFVVLNSMDIDSLLLKNDKNQRQVYRKKISNTLVYKMIPSLLDKGNRYEFFNCGNLDHIKIMFYTGYNAHNSLPGKKQIDKLLGKNITPAVFDNGHLPEWILNNKKILKIKASMWLKAYEGRPEVYW